MNLRAGGLWDSIKGEVMTDIDALWYFPGEVVRTVRSGADGVHDVLQEAYEEIETDINALAYLPEEIGKSAEQIVQPTAAAVTDPLNSVKWIALAGLGIYALTLVAPKIKKVMR